MMQDVGNKCQMVFDVACFTYPSVFEKVVENGKVKTKCLVCNKIIDSIVDIKSFVAHIKGVQHKLSEVSYRKINNV